MRQVVVLICCLVSSLNEVRCEDPPLHLERAITNLQALHSNCLVLSRISSTQIELSKRENFSESTRYQVLLNLARTPGGNDGVLLYTKTMEGVVAGQELPKGLATFRMEEAERFSYSRVIAKFGSNWFFGSELGEVSDIANLRMHLIDSQSENHKHDLERFPKEKIDIASLPLLAISSLEGASFEKLRAMYEPLNTKSYVFHSSETGADPNLVAGIWIHKSGKLLIRTEFSKKDDGMPVNLEVYSRNPLVEFSQGEAKGDLRLRTRTTWTTSFGKTVPKRIVLEQIDGIQNDLDQIVVDSEWRTNLNREKLNEKNLMSPFSEDSPLHELLAEMKHELDLKVKPVQP